MYPNKGDNMKVIIQKRKPSIALDSKKTCVPGGKPRFSLNIRVGRFPGRGSKYCSEKTIGFQSKTKALDFVDKVKESIEEVA